MTELPFKNTESITAFKLNKEAVNILEKHQSNYHYASLLVDNNYFHGRSKLTVSEFDACFMVWTKKLDNLIDKCAGEWLGVSNHVNVHKGGPSGHVITPEGFMFTKDSFDMRARYRPSWDDAPQWAMWLGQDTKGYFGWFQNKPEHTEGGFLKVMQGEQCKASGVMPIWGHWKFSIEERPVSAPKPLENKPAAPGQDTYKPEGKCPTALLYYINHYQGFGNIPKGAHDKDEIDVNFELKVPAGETIQHERGVFSGKEVKRWISQFHARLNELILKLNGEWPKPGTGGVTFGYDGEVMYDGSGFHYTRTKFNEQLNYLRGVPSWDDAPSWAKYLAQDSDGSFFFFEKMPNIGESKFITIHLATFAGPGNVIGDWRKSMIARPTPIEAIDTDGTEEPADNDHSGESNEKVVPAWYDYDKQVRTGPVPVGEKVNISADGSHIGLFEVLCVSEGVLFVRDTVPPYAYDIYNCAEYTVKPQDYDKNEKHSFVYALMSEIGESPLGNAGQSIFKALIKLIDIGKLRHL